MKTLFAAVLLSLTQPCWASNEQLQGVLTGIRETRDPRQLQRTMGQFRSLVNQATASEAEYLAQARTMPWPRLGDHPSVGARREYDEAVSRARWQIGNAVGNQIIDMYRPGGALHQQLMSDLNMMTPNASGRVYWYTGSLAYQYLNNSNLNPMGFDSGARWMRDRLEEIRRSSVPTNASIGAYVPPSTPSGAFWLGPPRLDMENPNNSTGVAWEILNRVGGAVAGPSNVVPITPQGGQLPPTWRR